MRICRGADSSTERLGENIECILLVLVPENPSFPSWMSEGPFLALLVFNTVRERMGSDFL